MHGCAGVCVIRERRHSPVRSKFGRGWRHFSRHRTTSAQGPSPILGLQIKRKETVCKGSPFLSSSVRHARCLVLSSRLWGRLCCMLCVESLVLARRNSHLSTCSCGRPQPKHPGWPGKTEKTPTGFSLSLSLLEQPLEMHISSHRLSIRGAAQPGNTSLG